MKKSYRLYSWFSQVQSIEPRRFWVWRHGDYLVFWEKWFIRQSTFTNFSITESVINSFHKLIDCQLLLLNCVILIFMTQRYCFSDQTIQRLKKGVNVPYCCLGICYFGDSLSIHSYIFCCRTCTLRRLFIGKYKAKQWKCAHKIW